VRTARTESANYLIDDSSKSIFAVTDGKKSKALKLPGLKEPTCLLVWPDEGHLVIGEADSAYLWAVRIEKDGSLGPGDRYYSLRKKPKEKMPVAAMTMDAGHLLYACTPIGIQVFDPTGRLSGVIAAPSKEPMTAITIGGAKADELFVAAGDTIYARKIQGKAAYTLTKTVK
jgi:enterochelin esterase family protein